MSNVTRTAAKGGGFLQYTLKDKASLYEAYMPFVKNGGLFIPTDRLYALGEEVFVLLTLMNEPEKIPISGKVVWIAPKGTQGSAKAGIGVQFNAEDNGVTRTKIETYLAGTIRSERQTNTM